MSLRQLKIPKLPDCKDYYVDENNNVFKRVKTFYPNRRAKRKYIKIIHSKKVYYFYADYNQHGIFHSAVKKIHLFTALTDREFDTWNKYLNKLDKTQHSQFNEKLETNLEKIYDDIKNSKKRRSLISDLIKTTYKAITHEANKKSN